MRSIGEIRIPFCVAVDCGFEGDSFARNVSKAGMYIEVPLGEKSAQIKRGMAMKLLITPFGSSPSAAIQGMITRAEKIKLSDGLEGMGLGVQFKDLSEELQAVLQRHISNYIQEITPAGDLRELGRSVFEQFTSHSLPSEEYIQPARDFIMQLSSHAKGRIKSVMAKTFDSSAEWRLGNGYLLEIGLQAMVGLNKDADHLAKQSVMDRVKTEILSFQNELVLDSEKLDVSDHAIRKELAEMNSRLSTHLKTTSSRLGLDASSETVETSWDSSQEAFVGILFDIDFFESYVNGTTKADLLDDAAKKLIAAILQDWAKHVEIPAHLPEAASMLLERMRILFLKIAFETRQLFKVKPLAKNVSHIVPHLKAALSQFLEIQKETKTLSENFHGDIKNSPIPFLERGVKHLTGAIMELKAFVSSLPVTPELAAAYYKAPPKFRAIIFDSKGVVETRKAAKPRPKIERPVMIMGAVFLLVALTLLGIYWLKGSVYLMIRSREAMELGILKFQVSDDTYEATVADEVWNKLSRQDRERLGEAFSKKLIAKDVPRVFLRNRAGEVLGRTINLNDVRVWILTPAGQE